MAKISKSKSRRGAELLEFTFTLVPLLVIVFVLVDSAWAIFVKSTLAYAVRAGVRVGITVTGTQATAAGGLDLTTMVKRSVQANALGFLAGPAGYAKIKVHYFKPPAPGSAAAIVDVCNQADGNAQLNIMQVSIQGFSLNALMPRLYGWRSGVDNAPTAIGAVAADLIEPSRDTPPIGIAP